MLWEYAPNWRASTDVTLEYRTDMTVSRSGREQRRALRRTPRRSLDFTLTLSHGKMRSFRNLVRTRQNQPLSFPDPVRRVVTVEVLAADADTVELQSLPAWLVAGAAVVLEDAERRLELTVASIAEGYNTVTFTTGAGAEPWRAGARLRPLFTGLLGGSLRDRHPVNAIGEVGVSFTVDPGSESIPATTANLFIHDGREVFARRPNWGEQVDDTYDWPVEQVDFGFGRITNHSPVTFGTTTRRSGFLSIGRDDADELENFFHRQRGRQGEFLTPTWLPDLVMAAPALEGTATLEIETAETLDDVYRAIAIVTYDGRYIFRTVESIADTVLTLDRPFHSTLEPSDVAMVSWLPVTRFGSDTLTLEWITDEVAQTALTFQTLEYLDAEDAVPPYDGDAEWFLEVWGQNYIGVIDDLDYLVNNRYPEITL